MSFEEETALVTGSSRGIGKAIAMEMARRGASVVVHGSRDSRKLRDAADEIRDLGATVHTVTGDWSDPAEVVRAATEAWSVAGRIDILINNAGIALNKPFFETTDAEVLNILKVNFLGAYVATREICREMVTHHITGRVLTVTSINGIRPANGFSAYGASKGALEAAMKPIALELAPHGILCNSLAVGVIDTDMNTHVRNDEQLKKAIEDAIPTGRIGGVDEIAGIACDLVEPHNSYMSGASITIDGGLLLTRSFVSPENPGEAR